ncbi:hypothetical protein MAPG_06471 [Magnaporthiopsis poae ATCC 64411]|uniref:Uncharacterized protein n=1 Tax=Magnaporthiopsis poae (strain ATCC 64411 / 73-15) TaxID=644358 RepID=A0A0C4E243_MAGP6|nr:hypothetical protein MAPG_06471 [Magnaporthiopsis poae ATCC 64411]
MGIHDELREAIEKARKRHAKAETPSGRAQALGSMNGADAGSPRPEPTRTRTRTHTQTQIQPPRAINPNFSITATTASVSIPGRQQQCIPTWRIPNPPPQQHIPTARPSPLLQPTGTRSAATFLAPNQDHPLLALRAGRPPNGTPKCPDCPHCRDLEAEVKAERARASRRWPLRLGAGAALRPWAWDHDISSTWSGEQSNACLWHRHFEKHGRRLGLGALFRLAEKVGEDDGGEDVGYSRAVAKVRELADEIVARRGVAYYKLLKGSVCDDDDGELWHDNESEEEEEEEEVLQPQEHADSGNSSSSSSSGSSSGSSTWVEANGTQRSSSNSSNEDLAHKEAAEPKDGPSSSANTCHPTSQPTSRQQRRRYQSCVPKEQAQPHLRAFIFGAIGDGRPTAATAAAAEAAQRVSRPVPVSVPVPVPVAKGEPDEKSEFTWRQKGKWCEQQQKKDGDDDKEKKKKKQEDEENTVEEKEADDTPEKTRPGPGEFVSLVVGFLSRDSAP